MPLPALARPVSRPAPGPPATRLRLAGTAAAGFSLGLVIGGLLAEISWRWVFFAPVIMASAVLVAALLFGGSFFGFQFLVVLYLQELRGWSSLQAALDLLVVSIDAVLAPTLTPRLVNRFGTIRVIFGGLCLAAVAYALFLPVGLDRTYAAMFPSMILLGLAFSLAYGPLTIAATDGVAEEEQGLAGGLLYTSFQFGSALGLSAVTAVNVAVTGSGGSLLTELDGFRAALVIPLAMAVVAAAVIASGLRGRGGGLTPEGARSPVDQVAVP